MDEVIVLREQRRGCGYRRPGLYFVGDGIFEPCERLPFPLHSCPTCSGGIRFSRGYTWIKPDKIFAQDQNIPCNGLTYQANPNHHHALCPMCSPTEEKAGLLWVGHKFYTPGEFKTEALMMGVSKRMASIPRGFEIGKTVIYLGHKKACIQDDEAAQGVFMAFIPKYIDVVVDTENFDEIPERAKRIKAKYGDQARIVKIEKIEQTNLQTGETEDGNEQESN